MSTMDLTERLGRFKLIQGGGVSPPAWLDIPSTVLARSVQTRDLAAIYRVAQDDVQKALTVNRRQPLLDLWSAVIGETPPFPNAKSKWGLELSGKPLVSMADAHACFRGIKRPLAEDDRGFYCFALVSKPTHRFAYDPSMACVIKLMDVPHDLVHITYVRCDYPLKKPQKGEGVQSMGNVGVVTHWHFVECDPTDQNLPIGYRDRYRQRIW